MKRLMLLLGICSIFLTGCSSSSKAFDYYEKVKVEEISSKDDMFSAKSVLLERHHSQKNLALYDNKLLYSERSGSVESFWILDFQEGITELVGGIKGTAAGRTPDMALVKDTLYFYTDLFDDYGTLLKVLYSCNFSTNEMSWITDNKYTKHRIPVTSIDNKLYALQGTKGYDIYSNKDHYAKKVTGVSMDFNHFIQMIDSDGNYTGISLRQNDIGIPNINDADEGQHQILYIDSDVENILAFEGIETAGITKYYFTKYTPDYNCIYAQDISSIFSDFMISKQITSFHAFGNFFMLSDIEGTSILCRCEENGVEVLLCENNLKYADNHCKNGKFEHFYIMGTNDIYRLELQSGVLETQDYNFDSENMVVFSMLAYDDTLLISRRINEEDSEEVLYLISLE